MIQHVYTIQYADFRKKNIACYKVQLKITRLVGKEIYTVFILFN